MLWLAPPVLFTAGMGLSWAHDNGSFGGEIDRSFFVDARVGYAIDDSRSVGLRLRGSHFTVHWADSVAPPPYDSFLDMFDLYTLDVGAFGELESQSVYGMGWVGIHGARVHATYNHYTSDQSATYYAKENFYTGPALAGGIALGVNVYRSGRYRVRLFGELALTGRVFMTAKSLEDDSYTYKPFSLGVAVRF